MPHAFREEDFMGKHRRQSIAQANPFIILRKGWNGIRADEVVLPSSLLFSPPQRIGNVCSPIALVEPISFIPSVTL